MWWRSLRCEYICREGAECGSPRLHSTYGPLAGCLHTHRLERCLMSGPVPTEPEAALRRRARDFVQDTVHFLADVHEEMEYVKKHVQAGRNSRREVVPTPRSTHKVTVGASHPFSGLCDAPSCSVIPKPGNTPPEANSHRRYLRAPRRCPRAHPLGAFGLLSHHPLQSSRRDPIGTPTASTPNLDSPSHTPTSRVPQTPPSKPSPPPPPPPLPTRPSRIQPRSHQTRKM